MTCEYLHCNHPSYAKQYTSFSQTSTTIKVNITLGIVHISQLTKHPTQLYSISTAALWAYDYLLTVGDEVRITNYSDAGRKLTVLFRSVSHGKQRTFSAREPSNFCGVALTNNASVFSLFLFVSIPHSRNHVCPDSRLGQIPSSTVPGVGEYQ